MRLKGAVKPSRVLGHGDMRSKLHGAMVLEEEGHLELFATNTYSFVRIDLGRPEDGDKPGPLPAPAVKHLEKGVYARLGEKEVQVGIIHYDRVLSEEEPNTSAASFPSYAYVKESKGGMPEGEERMVLALNPKLLLDLAAALGSEDSVEIVLRRENFKPLPEDGGEKGATYYSDLMFVLPIDGEVQAEGMFMPRLPNLVAEKRRQEGFGP